MKNVKSNIKCHKLGFSNPEIFATESRCRPEIFPTMMSFRSCNLRVKYYRFKPSGYKVIGIRKYEFVTKTQFLYEELAKDKYTAYIDI